MELPADFLSLGMGYFNLVSEQEYTITYGLRISDTMSIWYHSINIQ